MATDQPTSWSNTAQKETKLATEGRLHDLSGEKAIHWKIPDFQGKPSQCFDWLICKKYMLYVRHVRNIWKNCAKEPCWSWTYDSHAKGQGKAIPAQLGKGPVISWTASADSIKSKSSWPIRGPMAVFFGCIGCPLFWGGGWFLAKKTKSFLIFFFKGLLGVTRLHKS